MFLAGHLAYFAIQPLGGYNFALINQVSMLAMTFIVQAVAYKLLDKSLMLTVKAPDLGNLKQRAADEVRILTALEEEKPYLDDGLTLQQFAASLGLPAPYVTELINQKFNCTFKKLINRYRLEEAKRLMANSNGSAPKLIDIAYDAGFNDKVSFYRVFKEFEGLAPSEYLEALKKQANS